MARNGPLSWRIRPQPDTPTESLQAKCPAPLFIESNADPVHPPYDVIDDIVWTAAGGRRHRIGHIVHFCIELCARVPEPIRTEIQIKDAADLVVVCGWRLDGRRRAGARG